MKESRKKLILDIHKLSFDNSFNSRIEKEFPKLFVKEKLEVGKWYINKVKENTVHFITEIHNSKQYSAYGLNFINEWKNNENFGDFNDYFKDNFRLSTETEVFEALKKEAIKRGFKKGVKFKLIEGCIGESNSSNITDDYNIIYEYRRNRLVLDSNNNLYTIFKDGKWA